MSAALAMACAPGTMCFASCLWLLIADHLPRPSAIANSGPVKSADRRAGALAPSIFRSRRLPAGSLHSHRRSRGVGVESDPPLGVRQAAGGAEPGAGGGTARHHAAAVSGVLQ